MAKMRKSRRYSKHSRSVVSKRADKMKRDKKGRFTGVKQKYRKRS